MALKMKRKFQEGGQMDPSQQAAEQGQPEQGGAQGAAPEEQIAQMAQQIIQQLGPEATTMLVQMLTEMLQGGGQEVAPQEAPVYKRGGNIVRRIR